MVLTQQETTIINIMRILSKQNKYISLESIITKTGLEAVNVLKIISTLKVKGEIFEPRIKVYGLVDLF